MKVLIESKANINQATTLDNAIPFSITTEYGSVEAMKRLIEFKADINQARTKDGSTLFLVTLGHGQVVGMNLMPTSILVIFSIVCSCSVWSCRIHKDVNRI